MKLYVGGLGEDGIISADDLRPLFEKFGAVTECECVKSYAFVHMDDESAVNAAIADLHGSQVKGRTIKVERSENKAPRRPSQKLFVGNIKEGTTSQQLRELFEQMCPVIEADVIKNFGFVHVDADQARGKIDEIVRELNGTDLNGSPIRVQMSTSGVRQKPGMAGDQCYRCGRPGHWSKECSGAPGGGMEGRGPHGGGGGGPMRGGGGSYGGGGTYGSGGGGGAYGGYGGGGAGGAARMGGGSGGYGGRSDPYPPQSAPSYMRDRYDGYDSANAYGGGGSGGYSARGDPYASGGYGDRGGGGGYDRGVYDHRGGYDGGGHRGYDPRGGAGGAAAYERPTYADRYGDIRGGADYHERRAPVEREPPVYSTGAAYGSAGGAGGGGGGPMRGPDPYASRSDPYGGGYGSGGYSSSYGGGGAMSDPYARSRSPAGYGPPRGSADGWGAASRAGPYGGGAGMAAQGSGRAPAADGYY